LFFKTFFFLLAFAFLFVLICVFCFSPIAYLLGTANTASVFHHKLLMALVESESPFEIQIQSDGQMKESLKPERLIPLKKRGGDSDAESHVPPVSPYNTFNGAWEHPFTAHPKVDPLTGTLRDGEK
jgi:hypothetical protein